MGKKNLYLFIKKIDNYESGLINKIKYLFEYETKFMLEFNKFIFHKSDFSSYYYIKSCYTYKDLILHIHFNTTYNHYHSNFNINTDLSYFENIIPCGINDKKVTSLEKEIGHKIDICYTKTLLKSNIERVFDLELK